MHYKESHFSIYTPKALLNLILHLLAQLLQYGKTNEENKGEIMKKLSISLVLFTLLILAQAAQAGNYSLNRRSMLEFTLSARDYHSDINDIDFGRHNSFDNAKFSIGVNYWTSDVSAMTFSIAALDVSDKRYSTDYGIEGTESTILPMFFGTRLYMTDMNGVMPIKPYIAIAGGPVLGVNNYQDFGDIVYFEDDVYLTLGGYLGGGVDFMFGKNTTVGLQGGYNFYADFDEYVGERKNYSGAEIGVSLGILFGGDNHQSERNTNSRSKKRVKKF